jgi:hypothetical protein
LARASLPGRIAQFEAIAAGIEEIEIPPGEIAFGPVIQPPRHTGHATTHELRKGDGVNSTEVTCYSSSNYKNEGV